MALTAISAQAADPEDTPAAFFDARVHPILARRCYECHGPEKQESGLRLDSRVAILRGGDSETPAAVAGQPDKSLLIEAIRHTGDLKMPPDDKLPDDEIAVLVEWVAQELPWSAGREATPLPTTEEQAETARREHWSLKPVRRPKFPSVTDAEWVATGVDTFIRARLEAAGIAPSPSADRRTLLRRLSFDLWGLPPTAEEAQAFVDDSAPDAYARLVDRWLASPRYGERWGRHWLDVARYADTRGYAFANDRRYPYAYTYRDYVIGALNCDRPYDEFVLEQLAADQLSIGEDVTRLAAMGFLTTGRKFNNRQDDVDDQIDVVSRGLMGLTVACARCHDHKYDPVPSEDYYSLYGVFASSQEPDELPLIGEPKMGKEYDEFQKELSKRRGELDQFRDEMHKEVLKQSRERVADYLVRLVSERPSGLLEKLPFLSLDKNDIRPRLLERWRGYVNSRARADDPVFGPWNDWMAVSDDQVAARSAELLAKWRELPAGLQSGELNPLVKARLESEPPNSKAALAYLYGQLLRGAFDKWTMAGGNEESLGKLSAEERQLMEVLVGKDTPTDISRDDLSSYLNRADRNKLREFEKKIQSLQASSPAAPPRAMVLKEDERPHDPRVFIRGNADRPGKSVPRQFLLAVAGPGRQPFTQRSGRLELAQAIVNPANPLTRRVIANRIWMHHFGSSLVRTPSDFGTRCEPPLQLDLLNYLADRLLEQDWSLKSLHREILLSSAYQQASLFRLDAAERDPENRMLWRMNRQRLEFEPLRDSLLAAADSLDLTLGGRPVDLFKSPYSARRTVYGTIDRQDLPNLLRVFDFASPDQSQAERPRTTVPQQALYLMNSPFVLEQSRKLAARLEVTGAANDEGRISALYQILYQRLPTSPERDQAQQFISSVQQDSDKKPDLSAWEQLAQILLLTNEFCYVD